MRRHPPSPTEPQERRPSHRRAWLFLVGFGLLTAGYFAFTSTSAFKEGIARPILRANAHTAAAVLRVLGEDAAVLECRIVTPRSAMTIARGCDGLDPFVLYGAAILTFPAPVRRKLMGLAVGFAGVVVLNLFRITSLYYIGVWWPAAFETVHVEIWQAVFVFLVLTGWLGWALWASTPAARINHAGTAPTSDAQRA